MMFNKAWFYFLSDYYASDIREYFKKVFNLERLTNTWFTSYKVNNNKYNLYKMLYKYKDSPSQISMIKQLCIPTTIETNSFISLVNTWENITDPKFMDIIIKLNNRQEELIEELDIAFQYLTNITNFSNSNFHIISLITESPIKDYFKDEINIPIGVSSSKIKEFHRINNPYKQKVLQKVLLKRLTE